MATQIIIRVPDDLKSKVNNLAKAEGKNVSAVIRELLEDYVKNRDMTSYIDDLWARIGNTFKAKGVQPKDIERAIRESRAEK